MLEGFASDIEELEALARWISSMQEHGIPISDIGILAFTNDQLGVIEKFLADKHVRVLRLSASEADDRALEGIRICTMHRAKGLEFRVVSIPFMSESKFPPGFLVEQGVDEIDRIEIVTRFRSLLHVAATRAKESLRISWSGAKSRLLF